MYIEPQTNIIILKNVPLDTTYEHTIFFTNVDQQETYFKSLKKYDLNNYTYQRVQRGVSRVGIQAEKLYDCNYLMFKNAAFGNKWFYAYITSVEYINNVTSQINFELDVMQTWFFEHTPDYCFVEREHTDTDVIGEHIEPENVDVGEYVFNSYAAPVNVTDMSVILAIVDTEDETVSGNVYDGVYGGATLYAYRLDQIDQINAKIEEYLQKPDSIQTIYMLPEFLVQGISGKVPSGSTGQSLNIQDTPIAAGASLDGYIPKNNKMYTYPYNFINMDNGSGGALILRYEFFKDLTPKMIVYGTITQPVQIVAYPADYKGTQNAPYNSLHAESLQVNSYPMCSWNTDAYKAWVAQNTIPVAVNAGGSILGGVLGGILSGNPLTGVSGALNGALSAATSAISQTYTASIAADLSKGNFNNGNVNTACGLNGFLWGRASVSHQYAKSIDEFFTKFGYAVRRLKIPNRSARPHWNYVKTIGATLTGSVPADDMRKLCSIYDMGVTFWKSGAEVGNYSLDNSPGGAVNA